MRPILLLAFPLAATVAAACGNDAPSPAIDASPGDANASDAGADAQDAAPPSDASDAMVGPVACTITDAGDTCSFGKKCCPLPEVGPDGGMLYGCVILSPMNPDCPPLP